MKLLDILLVLASVSLSACSQIVLKMGMTSAQVRRAIDGGAALDVALALAKSPAVIGGFACFGLSAVVWLFVLSRMPLSQAYPFVSLGIVVTVVAGATMFAETVAWQGVLGVAMIVSGVVLVGLAR